MRCGITVRAWVASAMLLNAVPVAAQGVALPGRVQVAIGAGWVSGAALGERSADLRAAGANGTVRLFDSATDLAAAGLMEARVAFTLSRRVDVEGRAALAHPETRTFVSNDFENAAPATLVEEADQYVFDGGVLIRLHEWQFLNLLPFAAAGGGYVRLVHEENTLVENGQIYYVGGGVTRVLVSRSRGLVRALSARGDVRLNILAGGSDEEARRHVSASGSLVLTF